MGGGKIAKRSALLMLMAVLTLGLLLRFPTTGVLHEAGADGSYYAALTRMVLEYGRAPWTVNPLSYFGLFPYSEGPAIPILVASFSEVAGLQEVPGILLVADLVAMAGATGVFLCIFRTTRSPLGGVIGSLAFLTAPILILYSSGALISRFFEVCWVPFLMLAFIERKKWTLGQILMVTCPVSILLATTHLSFVLVAALFLGIACLGLIERVWRNVRGTLLASTAVRFLSRSYYLAFMGGCAFLVALASLVPLSYGSEGPRLTSYEIGVFPGGSPISTFANLLVSEAGGAGIVAAAFAVLAPKLWTFGKRPFNFPTLAALLLIFSLLGFRLYSRPLVAVIMAVASGLGFVVISRARGLSLHKRRRQMASVLIIALLIGGTALSMTIVARWSPAEVSSMESPGYPAFLYVHASTSGNLFCNHYPTDRLLTAYTGKMCAPDLPGSALEMVPFVTSSYSWSSLIVQRRSLIDVMTSGTDLILFDVSGYNPYANYFAVADSSFVANSPALERYDIHYVLEYRPYTGQYSTRWNTDAPVPSLFLETLKGQAYVIYQDENYSLWSA